MKRNSQLTSDGHMGLFLVICGIALIMISTVGAQNINEGISDPSEGVITGFVKDAETNDPISGAVMILKYHEIIRIEYTDVNGQYIFKDVPICFCLKNVSASKSGYEDQYQLVAVSKITYVNFSLKPDEDTGDSMYGVIKGMVSDAETNDVIPHALITLKYHDFVRTDYTDSNGEYEFSDVPICFCLKNVSASKSGYESQYQLVAVSEVTYVNFSLNQETDSGSNSFPRETSSGIMSMGSSGYIWMISGTLCISLLFLIGAYRHSSRKKKIR